MTKKPVTVAYDRLYGQIELSTQDIRLFQTKEMARLRHVSLFGIPSWTVPVGVSASRFEHSIGVAHLAKIIGHKPAFREISLDLHFAALVHDLGTPPFSHVAEHFLVKILGRSHEEFVADILTGSELADEIKKQGGDVKRIIALVKGEEKPWSDLINGSIDLDNLDNSLRFGISIGLLPKKLYSPERLARAFTVRDGQIVLAAGQATDLKGWEETRQIVYRFIYDGESTLSAEVMLGRALEFAQREGQLDKDYFRLTEADAWRYLATECNRRTRTLIEGVDRWQSYVRAFNWRGPDVSKKLADYILETDNRGQLADEISAKLKLPPEDVGVYLGQDKGHRRIHLPLVGQDGDHEHQPQNKLDYIIQVYLHPKWVSKAAAVKETIQDKLT